MRELEYESKGVNVEETMEHYPSSLKVQTMHWFLFICVGSHVRTSQKKRFSLINSLFRFCQLHNNPRSMNAFKSFFNRVKIFYGRIEVDLAHCSDEHIKKHKKNIKISLYIGRIKRPPQGLNIDSAASLPTLSRTYLKIILCIM